MAKWRQEAAVTIWELMGAGKRQRILVLIGMVLTLAAVAWVRSIPGVYSSDVRVTFLLPTTVQNPNSLQFSSESLIHLAGTVGAATRTNSSRPRTSSDVSLANSGVRDGYSITLPNVGGQWANNYSKPELRIQVAGPTAEGVMTRMAELTKAVDTTLASLQAWQGVSEENLVTTRQIPSVPPLYFNPGSRLRASLVTLGLGLALTLTLAWVVDSLRMASAIGVPIMSPNPTTTRGTIVDSKVSRKRGGLAAADSKWHPYFLSRRGAAESQGD